MRSVLDTVFDRTRAVGHTSLGSEASAGCSPPGRTPNSICLQIERDRHVLRLQVLLDSLAPTFAAEAGVLDAAERCGRVRDDPLGHSDHSRFQALADADGAGI